MIELMAIADYRSFVSLTGDRRERREVQKVLKQQGLLATMIRR